MTDTTTARPLQAGDTIHVLAGGVLLFGAAYRRGDVLTVTQKQIDGQRDTEGSAWTDDLSDDAQLSRWREIRLGFGPWPEGTPRWTYGDLEWAEQREEARKRAWHIEDPAERSRARQAVEEEFGAAPSTSRTINEAPAAQQRPTGNVSR